MWSHIFLFGSLPRRRPPEFTAILMFEFWREATAASVPGLLCQSGRHRPENVSILSSLLVIACTRQPKILVRALPTLVEFGSLGFLRKGENEVTQRKSQGWKPVYLGNILRGKTVVKGEEPLGARKRANRKVNPRVASLPGHIRDLTIRQRRRPWKRRWKTDFASF